MNIKIELNEQGVKRKVLNNVQRVQGILDLQVLKDSNYFCPHLEGDLIDKSSVESPGVLIWDSGYAKRQYYDFPNKTKDKNPNASMKWFEKAKAEKIETWTKVANAEYNI